MNGSIIINWGSYGGFYFIRHELGIRLCLGWIAFTMLYGDFDDLFDELTKMKNDE